MKNYYYKQKIVIYSILFFGVMLAVFAFNTPTHANNINSININLLLQEEIENRVISIDIKDKTISEALTTLKEITGIDYVLSSKIDKDILSKKFSLTLQNRTLKSILDIMLLELGVEWKIDNGKVYISPAEEKKVEEAKSASRMIRGKIVDSDRNPIAGAMVVIIDTNQGAITEADGNFTLNVENGNTIEISCMGYKPQNVRVRRETTNVVAILELEVEEMGDVTVVAFGTQKKESVVSAITTVKPMDLKSSSSDLTTSFAGKIAGMIGWQTGGMPGALTEEEMNTKFYIRGITSFATGANKDPLILLDGVEVSKLDLSRIAPEDIEAFSVMKDASATAMYGARGANGVILVTTKKGAVGSVYVTARYETVLSQPTEDIDVVDPITYMEMYNQAYVGRSTEETPTPFYTQEVINRTASGEYPDFVYPQNDWYNMMFKNQSINHRAGVTIRGGSKVIQYYASVTYNRDEGMLKTDKLNDFDVNITNDQIGYRTNFTINLDAGIKLLINSSATLDKYHGPLTSMTQAYGEAFSASPVDFAAMYPGDFRYGWPHLRFGGVSINTVNPYMELQKGYMDRTRYSTINKAEYIQDLDILIKGLELRASISLVQSGYYTSAYTTIPYMYSLADYDFITGEHTLQSLNGNMARRTLSVVQVDQPTTDTSVTGEAMILHTAAWGDHQTSFTGVTQMQERTNTPFGSVLLGIPRRNLTMSMRGSYGYKDRYFAELSLAYNGSERFHKDNRFGLFPAGGVAWVISREPFMQPLKNIVSELKFRASYGKVGNDGIYSDPEGKRHRFLYLPQLANRTDLSDPTINNSPIFYADMVAAYANTDIEWEIAEQVNFGLESKLFDGLIEFNIDAYQEIRHNIISGRTVIPSAMGIEVQPLDNIGKVRSRGIDLAGKIQHQVNNDFWFILNGTLTFAKAEYMEIEEAFGKPDWQLKVGNEISQQVGYIAEGLFQDWEEISDAPIQSGDVMPGDIRYKDINRDGVIGPEDATYIGYPETPRLIYGFSGYINYKGFELNFAFQGSGKRTFFMNPASISPFSGDNAMLTAIYEDHWSEDNQVNKPFWPNLSNRNIIVHNPEEDWYNYNNSEVRKSTYFMRECTFLRCTSLELAYNLPSRSLEKLNLQNLKIYLRANNLFNISNFDVWDVELGENGFNYPIQRTFSAGVTFSF